MATVTEKTIDIDLILKQKMGSKAKFVPGFLVSWLKRIIHQDQVNAFLWESRDKSGVEWLEECVKYLDMTLEIKGKEHLPDPSDGRLYTFVSNHPLGGEDGVALGAIIGRHYNGRFRYLVNDLLMNLPGLAPVCIPINKTGGQSRNFPAMVQAGFQSDNHMLMFPAGLCSRKQNGVIRDIPWTKTFISKSVEYQRDVVPIHFSGQNSNFFYRLANFSDKHLNSIWPCCFWSMKCTKTSINPSRSLLENPFPGRRSTRAKHRWNGQNLFKIAYILYHHINYPNPPLQWNKRSSNPSTKKSSRVS